MNNWINRWKNDPNYGKGLFQTNLKCGLIFPVTNINGIPTFNGGVPVFNDVNGEMVACQIMDDNNFVEWAVDPWTGEYKEGWKA